MKIFFPMGILMSKGGIIMHLKGFAITMGLGAAAGAVAIMMMPKTNPTRKLASKAAQKMEGAAVHLSNKLSDGIDQM